jgi:hypothetical protein
MDGPIVMLSNCCPGLLAKSRQSESRVEGIADFTGVEFVWISDKKIRDAYFPEADRVIVATYCVPSDIAKQLSKVDWMMRGEEEYHVRETDNLVKRIKVDRECFLYKYNDLTSEWEKYAVTIKILGKTTKMVYLWLIFTMYDITICYATIVCAIVYGVAPRFDPLSTFKLPTQPLP